MITPTIEGQLWQLPVATLGAQALLHLIAELLKSYEKTRTVNIYGFLRLESLGSEALAALRNGAKRLAAPSKKSWPR